MQTLSHLLAHKRYTHCKCCHHSSAIPSPRWRKKARLTCKEFSCSFFHPVKLKGGIQTMAIYILYTYLYILYIHTIIYIQIIYWKKKMTLIYACSWICTVTTWKSLSLSLYLYLQAQCMREKSKSYSSRFPFFFFFMPAYCTHRDDHQWSNSSHQPSNQIQPQFFWLSNTFTCFHYFNYKSSTLCKI